MHCSNSLHVHVWCLDTLYIRFYNFSKGSLLYFHFFKTGCGDGSDGGGAASASPRVEEPPPVPPAPEAPPQLADNSPTVENWDAETDDVLLTPEDGNEPDDEDIEQQVIIFILLNSYKLS